MHSACKKNFLTYMVCLTLSACNFFETESSLIEKSQTALNAGEINSAELYAKKTLKKNIKNSHARFIMAEIATLKGRINDAEIDYRRAYEAGYDINKVLPPFIDTLVLQKNHNDIPALVKSLPDNMLSQKHYWMGLFYLGNNHLEKAESSFDKSLGLTKGRSATSLFGKALIAINKNDYTTAIHYIDKALAIDANYLDAQLMKVELHTKQKQDTLALPILLSILKRNTNTIPAKKHFIAKSTLIQIYWRRKETKLAEKHIAEFLNRYRGDPIANYYGAMISYERKHYHLANDFLQQVLRVSPKHAPSLGLMGSIKYQWGLYEQADFYLSSALINNPDDPEISKLLAATRLKQNQTTSAISLLDETSTRKSDPLILLLSGKANMQAGNTEAGIDLLKEAAQLTPENHDMRMDIVHTFLSMGKTDKAIAELSYLDNPTEHHKQQGLSYVYDYIQKGDFNDALRETKLLINKNPDELNLYIALGNIYLAMQQNEQAIEAFEKAAQGKEFTKANLLLASVYIKNRQFPLAKRAFNNIIKVDSNHFQALSGLVNIAALEKNDADYQSAIEILQAKHPQNPRAFLVQARKQVGERDCVNAEITLKKVIQLDEKNVTAILMLATCLTYSKKINSAISLLQDKLKLPELKKVSHLHYQLAMLYNGNNNIENAIKSIKKAFELRPDNIDYVLSYTKLLKQTNKNEQAISILQGYVNTNAGSPQAHTLLADFFFSQQQFKDAMINYQKAATITPSAELAIKLFRSQEKLGIPSADNTLESWLLRQPDNTQLRSELASYKLRMGNFNAAISEYETLLKNEQENPAILNNLAWAYQKINNKQAISTAQRAYHLAPNSPEITDTYGWILVNMGKLQEGLLLLEKAYKSNPKSVDIQYHLAYALFNAKQYDRVQILLKKILGDKSATAYHNSANKLLGEIP